MFLVRKIKDHCRRMMCPPLKPVTNGLYIATPKNVARKMQRMSMEPVSLLQSRWGKQYKSCPTGVSIPKTKVKCVLQCDAGFVLKAGNVVKRANQTKASCQCKPAATPLGYVCKWDHKARECVRPNPNATQNRKPMKKKPSKKN